MNNGLVTFAVTFKNTSGDSIKKDQVTRTTWSIFKKENGIMTSSSVNTTQILIDKFGPFMDVEDLSETLRIKRGSLYQKIGTPDFGIRFFKRGKRYLFPTEEVGKHIEANLSG